MYMWLLCIILRCCETAKQSSAHCIRITQHYMNAKSREDDRSSLCVFYAALFHYLPTSVSHSPKWVSRKKFISSMWQCLFLDMVVALDRSNYQFKREKTYRIWWIWIMHLLTNHLLFTDYCIKPSIISP